MTGDYGDFRDDGTAMSGRSQQAKLRANEAREIPRSTFPWPSAVALLYPIIAMLYIASYVPTPPFAMIIGYGLANLGYMLVVAGIIVGHFRIFHLERRLHVILAGAAFYVLGTFLTNVLQS
ncbi:MAG: hypothetical protein AB7H90_20305 [Alphaproteobacteria bacterium]